MNDILAKWVEAVHRQALFSSDWLCVSEQNTTKFCPLGLLCDISTIGKWVKVYKPGFISLPVTDPAYPWTYVPTNTVDIDPKTLYGTSVLPREVQELIKFGTAVGSFKLTELSAATRTLLTSKLKAIPEFLSIIEISTICTTLEIPVVIEGIIRDNPPSLYTPFPSIHATTTE